MIGLAPLVVAYPSAASTARGPWLLTALPGLGRITWSCDPRRPGYRAYGLRLDASSATATESIAMRTGGRVVFSRRFDPPSVVTFPRSASATREITISQMIEPGTLRAVVTIDFKGRAGLPSHCYPYLPPAFTVRVSPR